MIRTVAKLLFSNDFKELEIPKVGSPPIVSDAGNLKKDARIQ